ncbi:MAG TPA: CPBP family intramembrane glutamic endopeptidase [Chthoniobacterales bacterium]|nr:CPBP family intramembrane glutamic endopeptidase [Chthoniobacterales bacterium]
MNKLKAIFIGADGLRHGWRFLLFAATIILLVQFFEKPAIDFAATKLHIDPNAFSAPAIIVSDGIDLILILIVIGLAALFERRRIDSYGLPVNQAFGGLFWNGVLAALAMIAFVGAAILVTGGMRIQGVALRGIDVVTAPLLWLVAMLFVGLAEEYTFRGYALQSLWRGAGFWPAALITTAIFAGDHLEKPHENAIDIGMIFALGLVMCLSVRITGSLWWAVGWHAAFDFGQLFIIGTPNGGRVPVDRLFDASFPGPAWITGGELGTEASYFMIPPTIATFIYVLIFLRRGTPRS